MKKSKRRLRRGSAMPMAIAVLLMLTAFSILILSTTMLEVRQAGRRDRLLRERLTVDAIGDSYVAAVAKGEVWTPPEGYTHTTTNENDTWGLELSDAGGKCLTITLLKSDGGYTITEWTYH